MFSISLTLVAALISVAPGALPASVALQPQPPRWVELIEVPQPSIDSKDGLHGLLDDTQLRFRDGVVERFERSVWRVSGSEGLESGANITIDWPATSHRLAVHWVRVMRGGEVVEPVRQRHVRLMQRERSLEANIIADTQTLAIFVPGLRVGDVVDCAWSTRGALPAMKQHYAGSLELSPWRPERLLHRRVLWASKRPLFVRPLGGAAAPQVVPRPWGTEYRWSLPDVVPSPREPRTPSWHWERPTIQLSDFDSWAEVARWGVEGYVVPETPSPQMQAWLTSYADLEEEARFDRAVEMVRNQVRYLGFEVGENGLRPHDPAQVFEQRFGDCKDKAFLLVTLLHHLGIASAPALVNSTYRHRTGELWPSPYAFDHVIVRAEVKGEVRWIDATMPHDSGPYAEWTPIPPYRALVLKRGTAELEPVNAAPAREPEVEVFERWIIDASSLSGHLTVETTLRRGAAHRAEREVRDDGIDDLQRRELRFYRQQYKALEPDEPPSLVRRGPDVVLTQSFRIPSLDAREVAADAWMIRELLPEPDSASRTAPWVLDGPTYVVQDLELISSGRTFNTDTLSKWVEGPGFRLQRNVTQQGDRAHFRYVLRLYEDHVATDDLSEYIARSEEARDLTVQAYTWDGAAQERTTDLTVLGLVFGVPLAAVLLGLGWGRRQALRASWRRHSFARLNRTRAGETAHDPMRVASREQLLRNVEKTRCVCGRRRRADPGAEISEVRMGEERVQSLPLECKCGARGYLYFRLT